MRWFPFQILIGTLWKGIFFVYKIFELHLDSSHGVNYELKTKKKNAIIGSIYSIQLFDA